VGEQLARVGEVELCYETFGDPGQPPVLLVMGLGTQMIAWHEDFCTGIAEHGYHVIRFDNRDCGRSTHLDHARPPTVKQLVTRDASAAAYTLADMASDTAGLLDHLGVDSAHVVGVSMGGMIAQTLASSHPERVRSLVSIMSTTGGRFVGQPAPRVLPVLLRQRPSEREAYVERSVALYGMIGSPGFERDEDELRELAGRAFDRDASSAGTGRQLAAVIASGDRTAELRKITAPTLVIHGKADRLVKPSGGRATARAIPGARIMWIEGMGHDLPRGAWPRIIGGIVETARRAGEVAPRAAV
jgi:pimeloyl-ACP methyl ester carboxylesterase